jgi:ribosome-binding factor A
MPSLRQNKVAEQLRQMAARFFEVQSNRLSMITVTRCDVSPDLRNAKIYITVLPDSAEQSALEFAKRNRSDLRDFVKKQIRINRIPFFEVELDEKERKQRRVDELLKNS